MAGDTHRYASRAGVKLEFALAHFGISPAGAVVADLGSQIGGFVDCLLQHGASRVYAVDTCYGSLAWKLRNDPRVVVRERQNALHVVLPEAVDGVTVDVAWTRQARIMPKALSLVRPGGWVLSLVKPQYEAGEHQRVRGVVEERSEGVVLEGIMAELRRLGIEPGEPAESPLRGGAGNREFLICVRRSA